MFLEKCFGCREERQSIDRPYEAVAFVAKSDLSHRHVAALQCIRHLLRFRRHHTDIVQA
jgi:hypothetical protein